MPVFVSRFSPNRVARANLQRIRSQSNQANERAASNISRREQRQSERSQGSNNTRQQVAERVRETLLARTQAGQRIAQQVQTTATQSNTTASTTQQTSSQTTTASPQATSSTSTTQTREAQQSPRESVQARLQTPPGVGATRTRADNDVERPGRLNRTPANPLREQILNGFARLRALASGRINQSNDTQQTTQSANANGRTNRTEARARFLASNIQQIQARRVDQQSTERPNVTNAQNTDTTPLQSATQSPAPETRAQSATQTPVTIQPPTAVQPAETPTAEEISRANTTEEIRDNLQQDASEISRGLTRDATRQLQQTTQQTAQNAERASENQRDEVETESRTEIRELETQERQLARELQQTQQDIRQERIQVQRAQSSASRSTTSSAAAIGSNVNILAG